MQLTRGARWILRLWTWAALVFLYLPLIVIAVLSFTIIFTKLFQLRLAECLNDQIRHRFRNCLFRHLVGVRF